MGQNNTQKILSALALVLLLVTFQNCAKKISSQSSSNNSNLGNINNNNGQIIFNGLSASPSTVTMPNSSIIILAQGSGLNGHVSWWSSDSQIIDVAACQTSKTDVCAVQVAALPVNATPVDITATASTGAVNQIRISVNGAGNGTSASLTAVASNIPNVTAQNQSVTFSAQGSGLPTAGFSWQSSNSSLVSVANCGAAPTCSLQAAPGGLPAQDTPVTVTLTLGNTSVSTVVTIKKPSTGVVLTVYPIIYNAGQTVKGMKVILDGSIDLGLFQAELKDLVNGCSAGGKKIEIPVDISTLAPGTHVLNVTMIYCDNTAGKSINYSFNK